MKEACELIEQISTTSGRNDKIALLESCLKDKKLSVEVGFLLQTAFDPYLNYGVRDFSNGEVYRNDIPTLEELTKLRTVLVEREVTGNDARELVRKTLLCKEPITRKWLVASFTKVLRAGIATGTINKIFPGLVAEFSLQLCDKFEDEELDGNWIAETKFDGLRCCMIFRDSECIEILSRNGRPLYNLNHIADELSSYIKDGVADGEAFGADWNDSAEVVRSSKSIKSSKSLKFYVFDFIPIDEWNSRIGKLNLIARKALLNKLISDNLKYVCKVPMYDIRNNEDAWKYANKFKQEGFEGAVVKKKDSVYSFSRNKDWLKLKYSETIDIPIIDIVSGTGRNKDRLGAFICKLPNGNTVNVGGGYSDEQREEFWKDRKELIGKIIECKYQESTANDISIRFPIFLRLRFDK